MINFNTNKEAKLTKMELRRGSVKTINREQSYPNLFTMASILTIAPLVVLS